MSSYKQTVLDALNGKEGAPSMCQEWKEWIFNRHPEFAPQDYKVGDWVIDEDNHVTKIIGIDTPVPGATLVTLSPVCFDVEYHCSIQDIKRKADVGEIEYALAEEAKKRGFVFGAKDFKGLYGTIQTSTIKHYNYIESYDRLVTNVNCLLYEKGEWADSPKKDCNDVEEKLDKIKSLLDEANAIYRTIRPRP